MSNNNISKQRIMSEFKKIKAQKLPHLFAAPLQDNLYNWHFTILGPENTQFHEGIYHGQIILPYEYPFKPPDIVFMNKNGRFQTNTKICLTITQYHPEEWNSAWTIRTMLEAVISLFHQNVQGVGSLTASVDIRASLAKASHHFSCQKCGLISNILKPRAPRVQNKTFPLKAPQPKVQNVNTKPSEEEMKMLRKFSQDQKVTKLYETQLNKQYSTSKVPENIIKQETNSIFTRKSKPFTAIPIKKTYNEQIPLRKQSQSQENYNQEGPQSEIIYVTMKNELFEARSGLKSLIQKIESNTSKLQRVYDSIRWV